MKDTRDRFSSRWKLLKARLESVRHHDYGDISTFIQNAFASSQKTWKIAIRAVSKDIQHGRIPDSAESNIAVLLLAWSIDSRRNNEIQSAAMSSEFLNALCKWKHDPRSTETTKYFVELCWPESIGYHNETHDELPFPSVFDQIVSPPEEPGELSFARKALMHTLDEEGLDLWAAEVSVESLAALATMKSVETEGELSRTDLNLTEKRSQYHLNTGLDGNVWTMSLLGCMAIFAIIAYFLAGMFALPTGSPLAPTRTARIKSPLLCEITSNRKAVKHNTESTR
jgi:hypothetical protein